MRKYEDEKPKNEEKIAKCEDYGLSEKLGEKGSKRGNFREKSRTPSCT